MAATDHIDPVVPTARIADAICRRFPHVDQATVHAIVFAARDVLHDCDHAHVDPKVLPWCTSCGAYWRDGIGWTHPSFSSSQLLYPHISREPIACVNGHGHRKPQGAYIFPGCACPCSYCDPAGIIAGAKPQAPETR